MSGTLVFFDGAKSFLEWASSNAHSGRKDPMAISRLLDRLEMLPCLYWGMADPKWDADTTKANVIN
jgi:hypothetical protein